MNVYSTKVLGHRGASDYAPENSIEAFKLAYDMGADGIEFDVHLTKDGVPVIAHDEAIDRVSNGNGFIKDFTLNELYQYDFNNNMEKFKNIKIPTLKQVLCEFSQKKFLLNIEIKNNIFEYKNIEKAVLELVIEHSLIDNVLFSSFNHNSVLKIKSLCQNAKCAFLFADGILDIDEYLDKYDVQIANLAHYLCTQQQLEKLHNAKKVVNVWTVNKGSDIRRFMRMGVDGIITNNPDLAVEIKHDKD